MEVPGKGVGIVCIIALFGSIGAAAAKILADQEWIGVIIGILAGNYIGRACTAALAVGIDHFANKIRNEMDDGG